MRWPRLGLSDTGAIAVPAAIAMIAGSALVAAQVAPPASANPEDFPDVVARVNATEISKIELLRRAEALKARLPPSEVGDGFYQRVLGDIVSGELLYQSVETKGLSPADTDVNAELESQSSRFGGAAAFESALQQQGITIDDVKLDLKKEIGIQRLVEAEFVPKLTVSDEEKRTFYDGNLESMQQPASFNAAHILISVDESATPEAKEELRKKAESIRNMVEMGQDFGELAAKNSGDPGSKDNGGELGWMPAGQTVPPFEAAMQSLQPGELSELVETSYGFHIIRLNERKDAGAVPYDEVQERIEEFLKQRGLQELIEQELDLLRSTAAIEVFI